MLIVIFDTVRNFFSYVLLISLLSPTAVEVFHAIHDSHEITFEENLNLNKHVFDCQINLVSYQDDDVNFFSNYSYQLKIYQNSSSKYFKVSEINLNNISSTYFKRGPPNMS